MPTKPIRLTRLFDLELGGPMGQLRAAPMQLGDGRQGFVACHAGDFDVDPWEEMFFFPTDTPKLVVFTDRGEVLWRRDLGPGVVPGMWFLPVLPFDLDDDGVDEIWFVNNTDPKHPLSVRSAVLERLDGRTGRTLGQWPWPFTEDRMTHQYRNFILAGHVRGEHVLVTAQGTYRDMSLQAWRPDMTRRWEHKIAASDPGARGSHMCPVADLNGDHVDEILWGERCIEMDDGRELFCADRDTYRGHSDVVQPVWNRADGSWRIYTCRESDDRAAPRIALYDAQGNRLWGHLDHGHIDMGWTARLLDDGAHLAMGIRIGSKTCGPDGRFHQNMEEFVYELATGQPYPVPFNVYHTIPVDLNGDGLHELVRGVPGGDGAVLDRLGRVHGSVEGTVAVAAKCADHPGEQILAFRPDGRVTLWADANAEDSPAAMQRYAHPFYEANRRLGASGSNGCVLGGV